MVTVDLKVTFISYWKIIFHVSTLHGDASICENLFHGNHHESTNNHQLVYELLNRSDKVYKIATKIKVRVGTVYKFLEIFLTHNCR